MLCRLGHKHPPKGFVGAALNPDTVLWGIRPYHCPECPHANKSNKVNKNWDEYPTRSAAREIHPSPGRLCLESN